MFPKSWPFRIPRTARRPIPLSAAVEALESRRLLSGAPLAESEPTPPPLPAELEQARYLRRTEDRLSFWATPDGSGAPIGSAPLPLDADLAFAGTDVDDLITIDMSGGDIAGQGNLIIRASAGDDRVRLINGDGRRLTLTAVPQLNGKKLDLDTADLKLLGVQAMAVEGLLGTARNNGEVRWQGPGIGTSAAGQATGLASIGQGSDTLVKFTYNGDVNGDGRVNADDYFTIDSCWASPDFCLHRLYTEGDLNFDDTFNADDYFVIDYAFLAQGEPLAQKAPAAAPDAEGNVGYLKRVGDELHAWASLDGTGEPLWTRALPLAGDLTLGGSDADDAILIDMSGGDIVIDGTLEIAASAGDDRVRLANGDGRLLTVGSVELSGKKLDLGTADLLIRDGDIYAIEDLVRSARRGATRWMGPGIGTSSAGVYTGLAPHRQASGVLVKYSYEGDMNGDGTLNADDDFRIDYHFLSQPPRPLYEQGDLNFDDKIDADDYFVIDPPIIDIGPPL